MTTPTVAQRAILERLYVGGPDLAGRFKACLLKPLRRSHFVEYVSLNGLLGVRLSDEGNFYMGATHADLDHDAAYWRRKTGESDD